MAQGLVIQHESPGEPEVSLVPIADLADMQAVVGGRIEYVSLASLPGVDMYINEEGKMSDPPLPLNPMATRLSGVAQFGDFIAGPALLIGADEHGALADIPEAAIDEIAELL